VALQHHLSISSDRIPELDSTILGTTHDPVSIGRQANAKHKVLREESQLVDLSGVGGG
jgi:hypothetical protein